jgi:hypothetical protein
LFKSERIGCYLNGFAGHGDDNETKELKLVFHVTPITPELAAEVSPMLADRLFRKNIDGEWEPAREITKAMFASVAVPMQNIKFYAFPDMDFTGGVMVQGAAISNLRAQRAFSDSLDFRLEFDVVVQMDKVTMGLVEQFYKATCFLTMEQVQREMEYAEDRQQVEEQQSLQEAADAEPETPKRRKKKSVTVSVDGEVLGTLSEA